MVCCFRTGVAPLGWWMAALLAVQIAASSASADSVLIPREEAARHGLERAWFAQIPVDPRRSRVSTWYQYFDRIYAVTDAGLVTALDAETGAQLWTKQVGKSGYPAFGPSANEKYLGVISAMTLYMLDRHDGRLQWSRELGSAPSSGPALSEKYAFVALVTGRVEGYQLDAPERQPWYYQSKGRTYLRPTVTGRVVSWPTTEGFLYVADANDPRVLFRFETNDDIVTEPAQQEPYIYIASLDGYLYCMNELTGRELWRFSTGYSITSSPAIVGDAAYVASFEPTLHAIDAKTGQQRWAVPGVSHFAAQGKLRVYASDIYGNLLLLDAKTGARQGRIKTSEGMRTLVNDQSDRIYLVNDVGLIQCLREAGTAPTMYRKPFTSQPAKPAAEETRPASADETPFAVEGEAAAAEDVPMDADVFAEEPAADEPMAEEPPAEEEPAADLPAEAPADDSDPFDLR